MWRAPPTATAACMPPCRGLPTNLPARGQHLIYLSPVWLSVPIHCGMCPPCMHASGNAPRHAPQPDTYNPTPVRWRAISNATAHACAGRACWRTWRPAAWSAATASAWTTHSHASQTRSSLATAPSRARSAVRTCPPANATVLKVLAHARMLGVLPLMLACLPVAFGMHAALLRARRP